ncbi:DUF2007 domain-containing protein [Enterovibrio sp. 27052020O]|uniref:putative signal transducing protein n=1 Tax=Enterovibrio sp. 27052020O TaxID=3241166 RepID=UPI0038910B5C
MSWIQVYSASNSLEAHSLKGMLESMGMDVMLKGDSLASATGELPADVVAVTLWVDVAREEKARTALQQYEAQAESLWFCPSCHEENGGSFEVCWQCSTQRDES